MQDVKCACCRPLVAVTVIGEPIPPDLRRSPLFEIEGVNLIPLNRAAEKAEVPGFPWPQEKVTCAADDAAREELLTKKVLRDTAKKEKRKSDVDIDELLRLDYRYDMAKNKWVPPRRATSLDYVNPTRRAQALAANIKPSDRAGESVRLRKGDTNFFQ